jgi:hypothetical protein
MAVALDDGQVHIIDLKLKKGIFKFSDNRPEITNRNLSLSWYQKTPTQLAVGFDTLESGV